jgi:hypothetical protein
MKLLLAVSAVVALGAGAAHAGVLYSNGGADAAQNGQSIGGGNAMEDSFTLTSASTITGIEFAAVATTRPSTVDWGIEAAPTFVDQGTASPSSTLEYGGTDALFGYQSDFSIPSLTLSAGTYWLALQNGASTDGGGMFWNTNFGPSAAVSSQYGSVPSESFTIFGSPTPEPASWAMMLLGVGMIGFAMRRRNEGVAVAA